MSEYLLTEENKRYVVLQSKMIKYMKCIRKLLLVSGHLKKLI